MSETWYSNSLYVKYCQEHFGGRSGPEMFSNHEEITDDFLSTNKEAKLSHQTCDKDAASSFILVITTPLYMLCQKVYAVYSICTFIVIFYQQTVRKIYSTH